MDTSSQPDATPSKCPVDHRAYAHFMPPNQTSTDAHPDAVNPRNMMPQASQQPAEHQRAPLDTHRELSTIPMAPAARTSTSACPVASDAKRTDSGQKEEVWVYPSQQMFFNALRRKSWSPREEDMQTVVPIHNAVNERAWQEILKWERMHQSTCGKPMLVRFQGRPQDFTPKARFFNLLGYKLPFDRHDWVVDRCGQEVTYVIDFYAGQPDPSRPEGVASFYLDVRPTLTLGGVADRVRRFFRDLTSE